ncbi:MAG: 30S ribosomal protein S3 [Armatimonadetes bacterium]|jgi:small subunit ribosomal protein S3|nr:30S ribosomal protein S3 [Armatimonadota bacterium]
MGQKVHPYGLRLGIIRQSRSTWFAEGKKYREQLVGDLKIRQFLEKELLNASVSNIAIERAADNISVTIETGKPGIVIGRGGRDVEKLRQKVEKVAGRRVRVNVEETKDPDTNAALVAQSIARQIERRVSYRRAMRQAIDRAIRMGAQGMRCTVSGRLQGAEIARTEALGPEGRVPLHTLRADVHFGFAEARTGYGNIGVKVWIYKGDILPPRKVKQSDMYVPEEEAEAPVEDVVAEGATEDAAASVEAAFETPAEAEAPAAPETVEAPTESVAPAEEPATEPEPEQGQ